MLPSNANSNTFFGRVSASVRHVRHAPSRTSYPTGTCSAGHVEVEHLARVRLDAHAVHRRRRRHDDGVRRQDVPPRLLEHPERVLARQARVEQIDDDQVTPLDRDALDAAPQLRRVAARDGDDVGHPVRGDVPPRARRERPVPLARQARTSRPPSPPSSTAGPTPRRRPGPWPRRRAWSPRRRGAEWPRRTPARAARPPASRSGVGTAGSSRRACGGGGTPPRGPKTASARCCARTPAERVPGLDLDLPGEVLHRHPKRRRRAAFLFASRTRRPKRQTPGRPGPRPGRTPSARCSAPRPRLG